MFKPLRVLFLTAPIGSGQTRAAQAVNKSILKLGKMPRVETKIADISEIAGQKIWQIHVKNYYKFLHVLPSAYGKIYNWGNKSG